MDYRPTETELRELELQKQIYQQKNYNPNSMQNEAQSKSFLVHSLNSKELLLKIHQRLLGKVWDPLKREYIQVEDAKVSERGASFFLSLIEAREHLFATLSELDQRQINKILLNLAYDFIDGSTKYAVEFGLVDEKGIPDLTKKRYVMHIICDNVEFNLCRALGGGERKLIRKTLTVDEKTFANAKPEPKRPSGFGSFFGLGRDK